MYRHNGVFSHKKKKNEIVFAGKSLELEIIVLSKIARLLGKTNVDVDQKKVTSNETIEGGEAGWGVGLDESAVMIEVICMHV
jgi:hypothetical protein